MPITIPQIIRQNRVFFICFFLSAILGGLLLLLSDKGDIILFFNGHRSFSTNYFFRFATRFGEWITYIVIMISFLFYRIRYTLLVLLTGIVVTIVSFGLKAVFLQNRPAAWFRDNGLFELLIPVDGVGYLTGASSFPSGHSMSAFALFALTAFIIPRKKGWAVLLFLIALLVGLSRVYLIHHFFMDVYAGAFIGVFLAVVIYYFQEKYPAKPGHWLERRIGGKKREIV